MNIMVQNGYEECVRLIKMLVTFRESIQYRIPFKVNNFI